MTHKHENKPTASSASKPDESIEESVEQSEQIDVGRNNQPTESETAEKAESRKRPQRNVKTRSGKTWLPENASMHYDSRSNILFLFQTQNEEDSDAIMLGLTYVNRIQESLKPVNKKVHEVFTEGVCTLWNRINTRMNMCEPNLLRW